MRTVNRHTLLGHVGNIIKLKNVLKVNIATNRESQADGERKTATDWAQVTILDRKQAAWIEENVGPGDLVYVESRVSNSSYERDGNRFTPPTSSRSSSISSRRSHSEVMATARSGRPRSMRSTKPASGRLRRSR
ncbi:single-stranded DNA-binding protein [Sinorhizobium medicae]|uniref:single-stranded DNA-binding protein n=1 Tax=Sinorhizobium medicae TaxID=110321 RepID=UPI002B1BDCB2|nr:single-stranded DNA-binding protein [Sinorhizobium medicae]WQO48712.1 single-stranded DNA-binding protein [Sinorhizobium medicae]